MSRPKVFVTQPIAESALARLRAVADVEVNPDSSKVLSKARLIEGVKRADILMSLLHDTVDREVLTANPNLKAVSSMNITKDKIRSRRRDRARHSGDQYNRDGHQFDRRHCLQSDADGCP